MNEEKRRAVIREYREALKEMNIDTWYNYLDGRAYNKETHHCRVCGQKVGPSYIGSHFQQTGTKAEEHMVHVTAYFNRCKRVFKSILDKHNLKLTADAEKEYQGIWWTARLWVRSTLWYWDEKIIPRER